MTFQYNEIAILKKLQSISSDVKVLKCGNRDSTLQQKYFCYLLETKSKNGRMTKNDFSKLTGLGKDAFYGLNGYQKRDNPVHLETILYAVFWLGISSEEAFIFCILWGYFLPAEVENFKKVRNIIEKLDCVKEMPVESRIQKLLEFCEKEAYEISCR